MEGAIELEEGNLDAAIELGREARRAFQRSNENIYMLRPVQLLCQGWLAKNRADSALWYALEYERLVSEVGAHEEANKLLAMAYEAGGDYQQAYHYKQIVAALSDSSLNRQKQDQLSFILLQKEQADHQGLQQTAALEAVQAAEQKAESERATRMLYGACAAGILLLLLALVAWLNRQRLARLKREVEAQRDTIAARDADKALLLKEIHHRVKHNLQVVSSLLELQAGQLGDDVALAAVQEGKSRVKSVALIHQKLYNHEQLANVDFQDYIELLVTTIADTFETNVSVERSIRAAGVSLDIDTAIPLGLILNELITNAYKYAFNTSASNQQPGTLKVELLRTANPDGGAGTCTLTVADNGPGLPENFDPAQTESLGMSLVAGLSHQLEGTLSFANSSGAVVTLTFPERSFAALAS